MAGRGGFLQQPLGQALQGLWRSQVGGGGGGEAERAPLQQGAAQPGAHLPLTARWVCISVYKCRDLQGYILYA